MLIDEGVLGNGMNPILIVTLRETVEKKEATPCAV